MKFLYTTFAAVAFVATATSAFAGTGTVGVIDQITRVPEPGTLGLLAVGIGAVAALRRRR
jgi:hypothetical protein